MRTLLGSNDRNWGLPVLTDWRITIAYVDPNYTTKKEFIAAIKAGKQHTTYNPSGMFPTTQNGNDVIEGPHYPKPHKWYASVVVKEGIVIIAK